MKLVALSTLPNSDSSDSMLHSLIFSASSQTPSTLRVVWDLGQFAKQVLSRLPNNVSTELSRPPHRTRFGNYKLYYITEKVLSISLNGSEVNIYDLSQYFPDSLPPKTHTQLQEMADHLQSALSELGISSPATLSSPVALARGSILLKDALDSIPTVFDASAPYLEVYELALQCTPREWVSNFAVGHFPELWGYDVSSAYPFQASQLLDLRDCQFSKSTEMDETAYYGFLLGDFTVYPDYPLAYCSPFLTDRGDGTLVNFTGTVQNYPCLLDEVRTLYRYGLGEFKLKYGWLLKPLNGVRPRFPLKALMDKLYALRNGSGPSADMKSYILKRVMNGLIGKMLEARKDAEGSVIEYGSTYNPIYHAICTTRTRLQVFEFIVQHGIAQDELVHVGVDGVKATAHIPGIPAQAPMGQWRCYGSEPAFILSPAGIASPSRDFKGTRYIDLLRQCIDSPGSSKLGVNGDIDLKRLWVNQNREYSSLPRTGKALLESVYESRPIEL